MNALIPLAHGVEPLEAVTIIDVLRRAHVSVTAAAIDDKTTTVRADHHVLLAADTTWDKVDLETFEALILPGGGTGTENLGKDPRILEAIRTFDASGRFVCAICAAPTLLTKAGLLGDEDGRQATCYPSMADELGKPYTEVPVIVDGNLITSQGPGTALLFALVLVEHFVGQEIAQRVAHDMLTSLSDAQ